MLKAKNISFNVGGKTLVSDFSAAFAPGELHLIIGPNGAGKSTVIKLLARLLRPHSGVIEYGGADVSKTSESELAKRRAVLSQAVEIAFPLTVREVVLMGRYPHFQGRPSAADEAIVDELMELFEVAEFAARDYQTLSGGERQRVNFARVLAQLWRDKSGAGNAVDSAASGLSSAAPRNCRYLFLDEPLTFLDVRHQIEFMKKVRDFAGGADVVAVGVVHDLNLAARFSDRIILLDRGRVVAAGAPADVLTSELIMQVFGVKASFISSDQSGVQLFFE